MTEPAIAIDSATLISFHPLQNLTRDEVTMLLAEVTPQSVRQGDVLIMEGSRDERALYLLEGSVDVRAADGRGYVVTAHSPKAKEPISHLLPHHYTVTALSPVTCFWVVGRVIDNLLERQNRSGEAAETLQVQQQTLTNPVFQAIHRDLNADRLMVPALPDIVVRFRNIVNTDADVRRIKALIQTDPALTALLMKVANSAIYRADKPIGTIEAAIARIGLKALQNFVIGFALRKLFKTKSAQIKKQMENLWRHSTEVAAIAYVLARRCGKFDPDHAMLLGLLHDIGMLPVLSYAELFPEIAEDEHELAATIKSLHGDVGGLIMTKWNFPDDFAQVARESDHWSRDAAPEADYSDLVLVAQLFSFMGKHVGTDTPPVDERVPVDLTSLPAYRKLGLGEPSPESAVALLKDAREEIAEAMHLIAM